jgi:predicted nucleotidyltransferase component of viral defense system
MNLHLSKELFNQAIIMASEVMMINPAIIEKDYYVTYLLKELVTEDPDIIFKGGTSLSKCYKLINRFSEDIDLTYDNNRHKMSEAKRRDLSHYVVQKIKNCEFELLNQDDIKSRRNFNQYVMGYDSAYSTN